MEKQCLALNHSDIELTLNTWQIMVVGQNINVMNLDKVKIT